MEEINAAKTLPVLYSTKPLNLPCQANMQKHAKFLLDDVQGPQDKYFAAIQVW